MLALVYTQSFLLRSGRNLRHFASDHSQQNRFFCWTSGGDGSPKHPQGNKQVRAAASSLTWAPFRGCSLAPTQQELFCSCKHQHFGLHNTRSTEKSCYVHWQLFHDNTQGKATNTGKVRRAFVYKLWKDAKIELCLAAACCCHHETVSFSWLCSYKAKINMQKRWASQRQQVEWQGIRLHEDRKAVTRNIQTQTSTPSLIHSDINS